MNQNYNTVLENKETKKCRYIFVGSFHQEELVKFQIPYLSNLQNLVLPWCHFVPAPVDY